MANLNSLYLFVRTRDARGIGTVRQGLERAVKSNIHMFRPDERVVTAVIAGGVLALEACLKELSSEGDLDFLVSPLKDHEYDLYWSDVAGFGLASRYGQVVPWRIEVDEVQVIAPSDPRVLEPLLGKSTAKDRWRLRSPLVAEPRESPDPTLALDLVAGTDQERRRAPQAWRPLLDLLARAAGQGVVFGATLLSSELGAVGSIDVRPGRSPRVSLGLGAERVLLRETESAQEAREWTEQRWVDRPGGPPASADTKSTASSELNARALGHWRGTRGFVDELVAAEHFRKALDGARRSGDTRLEQVILRNLMGLLGWRQDLRAPSDSRSPLLGTHNLAFMFAKFKSGSRRDSGVESLKQMIEARTSVFHFCQPPVLSKLPGSALLLEACLGSPCSLHELGWLREPIESAIAVDLHWRDPDLGPVYRVEGAYPQTYTCDAISFFSSNHKPTRDASRSTLKDLLGTPYHLDGNMLLAPIPFRHEPSEDPQRYRFDFPARSEIPKDVPIAWRPLIEEVRAAVAKGVKVSGHLCWSAAAVELAYVEGDPEQARVLFWFNHELVLARMKDRVSGAIEYDENGVWGKDTEDESTIFWRRAVGGQVGDMEGIARNYAAGRWGPVDERAAATWYRRMLHESRRQNDHRWDKTAIANFRALLERRPDLGEPDDIVLLGEKG